MPKGQLEVAKARIIELENRVDPRVAELEARLANLSQIVNAKEQTIAKLTEDGQRSIEASRAHSKAAEDLMIQVSQLRGEKDGFKKSARLAQKEMESWKAAYEAEVDGGTTLIDRHETACAALRDIAGAKWPRLSSPLIRRAQEVLESIGEGHKEIKLQIGQIPGDPDTDY